MTHELNTFINLEGPTCVEYVYSNVELLIRKPSNLKYFSYKKISEGDYYPNFYPSVDTVYLLRFVESYACFLNLKYQ